MNAEEVDGLLSEYVDNREKIALLCKYGIRKHHTQDPFLFGSPEIDELKIEKRTKEVLIPKAKNYKLVEFLQGARVFPAFAAQSSAELSITSDFVWAVARP